MDSLIVVIVISQLILIIKFMEELKELIARLQQGVSNIKQDITEIKNGLPPTGGLSAEQVAELKASLTTAVQQVEDLDAENPASPTV